MVLLCYYYLQWLRGAITSIKQNGEQSKMYDENELFTVALGVHIHYQVKNMESNLDEGELHIHIHVPPSLHPIGKSHRIPASL